MKRRSMLAASLAAPWAGMALASAGYPAKPVTMVVGYSAGGNVDSFARALGTRMARIIGQSVVIDNKPGANEMIATQHVARAEPDGHTLLICTEAPVTQSQFLYKKIAYAPEDLVPITLLVQVPMVLVGRPDLPVRSLQEFLDYAKKNPIIGGSAGIGGVTHLPMAMLARKQNIQWTHAPYKGSPAMFPDLIAGRIDCCFTGSSAAIAQIKAGNVKGLGVGTSKRLAAIPDVQSFEELGIQDIGASYTIGAYGPKNLPEPVRMQLAGAFAKVLRDPEFVQSAVEANSLIVDGTEGAAFRSYLERDRVMQRVRVAASGAQLE